MTRSLAFRTALAQVREGRLEDAESSRRQLAGCEQMLLDAALAYRRGDTTSASALATRLWHACAADRMVMSMLVELEHPHLREPAGVLLMRMASVAARDAGAAWQSLASDLSDLDAWREIISHLIASGREIEAVAGVAHALSERAADFALWALLATEQVEYRQRAGLLATIDLGRQAFPHAPEMHATAAMILLGLGDLPAARAELAEIGERVPQHPLVVAARGAIAAAESDI